MRSHTTRRFRAQLAALPEGVRAQARTAYRLFQRDPGHPSLQLKKVHPARPIYSVRISLDYRAAGVLVGEEIVWFFIGRHAVYDKLLKEL